MRKQAILTTFLIVFGGISAAGEPAHAEIEVDRDRIAGQWRVHCSVARPSSAEEVEKLSDELKRRCKREANSLASKQHLTSGSLLRTEVGRVESDEKKTKLTVNVDLIGG